MTNHNLPAFFQFEAWSYLNGTMPIDQHNRFENAFREAKWAELKGGAGGTGSANGAPSTSTPPLSPGQVLVEYCQARAHPAHELVSIDLNDGSNVSELLMTISSAGRLRDALSAALNRMAQVS